LELVLAISLKRWKEESHHDVVELKKMS